VPAVAAPPGTFRNRLAQMVELFSAEVQSLPVVSEFRSTRPESGNPGNVSARVSDASAVQPLPARLLTYQVWCFLFREAVIARDAALAELLIEWLLPFTELAPLEGVEAAVEQVRLYLTLRAGYQSRFMSRERLQDIMALCGTLPLGLLLPFMQTTTDAEDFDRTVRQVWSVASTPLCAPPGAASAAGEDEGESEDDDEHGDGDGPGAGAGAGAAHAPWDQRRSSKDSRGTKSSGQSSVNKGGSKAELSVSAHADQDKGSDDDEQSDVDDESCDEDSLSVESDPEAHFAWPSSAVAAESPGSKLLLQQAPGQANPQQQQQQRQRQRQQQQQQQAKAGGQGPELRRSSLEAEAYINELSVGRPKRVGEQGYCTVGTLEKVGMLRRLSLSSAYAPLAVLDKKLIQAAFRPRRERSAAAVGFMTHLAELEANSARVVELELRFGTMASLMTRNCLANPMPLALAQSLYVAAVQLATVSNEFAYSQHLRGSIAGLMAGTKQLMSIAFDAARAVVILQSALGAPTAVGGLVRRSSASLMAGGVPAQLAELGELSTGPKRASLLGEGGGAEVANLPLVQEPVGKTYDPAFFRAAPPGTLVAMLPQIWLQVDPGLAGLASNTPDVMGDEERTSIGHGVLRVYKNRLTWVLVQPPGEALRSDGLAAELIRHAEPEQESEDFELTPGEGETSFKRRLGVVASTETGRLAVYNVASDDYGVSERLLDEYKRLVLPQAEQQSRFLQGSVLELTKPIARETVRVMQMSMSGLSADRSGQASLMGATPAEGAGAASRAGARAGGEGGVGPVGAAQDIEVADSLLSVPMSEVQRYTWGMLTDTTAFLAIYTSSEVIKLYPFARQECSELVVALNDLSGIKPFPLGSAAESGFKKKLEDLRMRIFRESILPHGKVAWITHTEELWSVLQNLTKDDAPIKLVELERLYHSCRVNKAVVAESIAILKELCATSKSQDTIVKIIAIVDRLLDGVVLKGEDETLTETLKWLHDIETTLDPTFNATPLKMILRVCHRAEALQSQTIVPLVEVFYDSDLFEMRDALARFKGGESRG
jgi:hypothetical protein